MKRGDRLQVIGGEIYVGWFGTFVGLTRDGWIIMEFEDDGRIIECSFHPQDLEMPPVVRWDLSSPFDYAVSA
jgi:hypothetical protein